MRCLLRVAAVLIGLQLAGCYTDYGPVFVPTEPVAFASGSNHVRVGDRIKVTVYGEDSLNGVYDVDAVGNLSLPLAGTVRAAGLSKRDLEREITRRYRSDFLQDPKVTVDIAASGPFYIMGEAEKPGEYPYRHGLTVMGAIATAGGATYRASRSHVLIQHAGQGHWTQYPLSPEIPVAPGDVIRLPERYF